MKNQKTLRNETRVSILGGRMALGLVLGGLLGFVVDNLVLFAGGGMVIGLALGTAIENRRSR